MRLWDSEMSTDHDDFHVNIGSVCFHLHKSLLLPRSGKLNRIIIKGSLSVAFHDFPGGPEIFELAVKFCCGEEILLSEGNVCGVRCAAEYLEMTEDLEEGNLISKTEAFLSYVVFASWNNSLVALKSCENLSPLADHLQIVRRCSESIAKRACSYSNHRFADWWFEDVSILRIDHFVRVITGVKVRGMKHELVGSLIEHYARKWLLSDIENSSDTKDKRVIAESLIGVIIPCRKRNISCRFMLSLLRIANRLKAGKVLVSELEKKVALQLEEACLDDLLIPCYDDHNQNDEKQYDVDLVIRLLELRQQQSGLSELKIGRLLDRYIEKVAADRKLSMSRFQALISFRRHGQDAAAALYQYVDMYLKSHRTLNEHERYRLCRLIDTTKLPFNTCVYAVNNDRLPMRFVLQLFLTQIVKTGSSISVMSMIGEDIEALKMEMEGIKTMESELQRKMKQQFPSSSSSGWKKFSKITTCNTANSLLDSL